MSLLLLHPPRIFLNRSSLGFLYDFFRRPGTPKHHAACTYLTPQEPAGKFHLHQLKPHTAFKDRTPEIIAEKAEDLKKVPVVGDDFLFCAAQKLGLLPLMGSSRVDLQQAQAHQMWFRNMLPEKQQHRQEETGTKRKHPEKSLQQLPDSQEQSTGTALQPLLQDLERREQPQYKRRKQQLIADVQQAVSGTLRQQANLLQSGMDKEIFMFQKIPFNAKHLYVAADGTCVRWDEALDKCGDDQGYSEVLLRQWMFASPLTLAPWIRVKLR